jgi:hypothetical protein
MLNNNMSEQGVYFTNKQKLSIMLIFQTNGSCSMTGNLSGCEVYAVLMRILYLKWNMIICLKFALLWSKMVEYFYPVFIHSL